MCFRLDLVNDEVLSCLHSFNTRVRFSWFHADVKSFHLIGFEVKPVIRVLSTSDIFWHMSSLCHCDIRLSIVFLREEIYDGVTERCVPGRAGICFPHVALWPCTLLRR